MTGDASTSSGGQEPGSTTTGGLASSGSDAGASGSGDGESAAASTTGGETTDGSSSGDTSGSGGSSSGGGAVCGDGVVDPGEDCDDPGTACNAACVASRVVFVTSTLMSAGAIDGILGADLQCQKRAKAANLPRHERYRSWLSTSKFDARDRVEHHTGRYILVTGEVVAEDFDELVSGQLQHAIDTTEAGDVVVVPVWTGTNSYGYAVKGVGHCEDFTQSELIEFDGIMGDCSVADADWTQMAASNPNPCDEGGALYCIEHP